MLLNIKNLNCLRLISFQPKNRMSVKKVFLLFITIIYAVNSFYLLAQTAAISEKHISLLAYFFSDPYPVNAYGEIYPYIRFEGYLDKGVTHKWKMADMENDDIELWITPEIGGKIWGTIEKSTGVATSIEINPPIKTEDFATMINAYDKIRNPEFRNE